MSIPLSTRLPGDIKKAYAEYEAKHEQYVKDIKAYNEAAKAWNAGSRTSLLQCQNLFLQLLLILMKIYKQQVVETNNCGNRL